MFTFIYQQSSQIIRNGKEAGDTVLVESVLFGVREIITMHCVNGRRRGDFADV